MNPEEPYVSVIEPISPAIEHVKTILFQPFDLGRWFVIGFCAWLANLGPSGGGGGSGGPPRGPLEGVPEHARQGLDELKYQVAEHLTATVSIGVIVLVLVLAVWLLVLWLSSRGRFMFLYCVAQNKAEVRNPWHQFRRQANSLVAFRIVVGILGGLAVAAFVVPALVTVYVLKVALGSTALSILGIVAYVVSFVAVMTVFAIIGKFTRDFVVPIMYLHGVSCRRAWATLLDLVAVNKMRLVLYLLFQIVIGFAIGAIVFALSCVTCCVAGCLFLIPYVGTVALLPVVMFKRAYSLHYLAQYGPDLNVFLLERPAASSGPEPMS